MGTNAIAIETLKKLARPSSNGFQVTICPSENRRHHMHWVAIRYPLNGTAPADVLRIFRGGSTWPDAADWALDYLCGNPGDGFCFT